MGKVQIVLNGRESTIGGPGPSTIQLIKFVKAIPDGKYYNHTGIGECLGKTRFAIKNAVRKLDGELDGHALLVPSDIGGAPQLVYGSKKSITVLKKQLQESGLI